MTITDTHLFFWGDSPYTNFTPCEVIWEGITFRSSEQAFMWAKARQFRDEDSMQKILEAKTPREAKKLGRQVKNFVAKEWSQISYNVMKSIVKAKFDQHKAYREKLLEFNGEFVEASPFDKIWGSGYNEKLSAWCVSHNVKWPGENKLGKILTELRNEYAGN